MVWMKQCRPANLSIVLGLAFVLVLVYYTLYTEMNAARIERVSLRLLLRTSIIAAIKGGDEVVKVKQRPLTTYSKGLNQFGNVDPLTDGDLRSHRAMSMTLLKVYPHLNLVSEEHESDDKAPPATDDVLNLDDVNLPESISTYVDELVRMKDILVWIDPLDATQEYTESTATNDLTNFVTTMVCIAVKGQPKIGVIHQPFSNRTVWAWVGQGPSKSLRNPQAEAQQSQDPQLQPYPSQAQTSSVNIVVSRSHAGSVERFARDNLSGDIRVTPAGGAGFKALQVVEGQADLYIHTTLIKKWDICAGNALLEAMGGKMMTLQGNPIDYGSPKMELNTEGVLAFMQDKGDFMRLTRTPISDKRE